MKQTFFILVLLATVQIMQAQAPGMINYQGVARNSVGNVLANKTISLRLTIHDGSTGGPVVYQESRTVTTNPFGLFNVQPGSGGASNVTGTMAGVPWGSGSKFLQVEIDPEGGSTFINIGTAQIAATPYSLFANLADDLALPFQKTQAESVPLFQITNSGSSPTSIAIDAATNSQAAGVVALKGTITSTTPGNSSIAVLGTNNGTNNEGYGVVGIHRGGGRGVLGESNSGFGVFGTSNSSRGVFGNSSAGQGVVGNSQSGIGVLGTSQAGVAGTFINTNAANPNSALDVRSDGAGYAMKVFSFNAAPQALQTLGELQFRGIGESNDFILRTDASGNATWVDPATVIPGAFLWTRVGTNLFNTNLGDNVGIGTTNPGAGLVVSGTGWKSAIGIENTAGNMEWRMNVDNTTFQITKLTGTTFTPFQLRASGEARFPNPTSPINNLTILANGNVGIGSNVPSAALEVRRNGQTNFEVVSETGYAMVDLYSGGTDDGLLRFFHGNNVWGLMQINNENNMVLGQLSPYIPRLTIEPTGRTTINGDLLVNNGFGVMRNASGPNQLKYYTTGAAIGGTLSPFSTFGVEIAISLAGGQFTDPPQVFICGVTGNPGDDFYKIQVIPYEVTATGCKLRAYNNSNTNSTFNANWIIAAVGH